MQQHHVPQQRNASKPIKASVKGSSEQPSISRLANLGIKVRDFAYDSKLPPIQTIYCHPRQFQPAVVKTTLEHQRNDNLFSQSSSHPETSQKKLKRTSTEPVIPPSPDSTDTDSDSDDLFSQSSSHPETIQKKLKRTSTEPVILPTPDSTDGNNYFSLSILQRETSQKNLPIERTSTAPAIPLTPTPSPDSTDTDTDSDDYFSQSSSQPEISLKKLERTSTDEC